MKKLLKLFMMAVMAIGLSSCDILDDIFGENTTETSSVSSHYKDGYKQYTSQDCTIKDISTRSYMQSSLPLDNPQLLVVPVYFSDSFENGENKDSIRNDIITAFSEKTDDVPYENVKSYYDKLSYGKTQMQITVADWYDTKQSTAYYGIDDSSLTKTTALVNDICNSLSLEERKNLDSDGDGYIDSIAVIYAAKDYKSMKAINMTNLWAYCFWSMNEKDVDNPTVNSFMWASYDFMYASPTEKIDCRTYIHETGHLFGLDDYYDYNDKYKPAGGWGMQDENVGSHDPYSRLVLGWYKNLYVINGEAELTVNTLEVGDIIMICPNYDGSPFNEYYLIDVYSPTGLNEYDVLHEYRDRKNINRVNDYGFRIWHVDSRLVMYYINEEYNMYISIAEPYTHPDKTYEGYYPIIGNSNTSVSTGRRVRYSYIQDGLMLLELVKDKSRPLTLNNRYFAADDLFRNGDSYKFTRLPNTNERINLTATFEIKDNEYKIVTKSN